MEMWPVFMFQLILQSIGHISACFHLIYLFVQYSMGRCIEIIQDLELQPSLMSGVYAWSERWTVVQKQL